MKKYLLYILGGAVAAVAMLSFIAVPLAQAVDGSTVTLVSTNFTLSVRTNATSTIAARSGSTGKSADIVIQNVGTAKVYYTLDGTTPTSANGLVLYPPQTASDTVSGVTNTWTVVAGDRQTITDNQGTITFAVDTSLGAGTNKVQVQERYYIKYQN
jgi:hypothetical protein